MMRNASAAIAMVALASGGAASRAQPAGQSPEAVVAYLAEIGTWDFEATRKNAEGEPECRERWTFNTDNNGLIVSGNQIVTMRWFVRHDEPIGTFVYIANVSSTDGPDCMGNPVDHSRYPYSNPGYQLLFYGTGQGALVCIEGRDIARPDGSRVNVLEPEDCWGRIVPAMAD